MTRRGFLQRAVATAVVAMLPAKAIVALLPAAAIPVLWGDGHHDDTLALRAWGAGRPVIDRAGMPVERLNGYRFMLRETLVISRPNAVVTNCCFTLASHLGAVVEVAA